VGRLDDKVAVISGASSGIGRATMELFGREGATVVGTARREEQLNEALAAAGGKGKVVPADLEDPATADKVAQTALDEYGRIDILVNNAGGVVGQVGKPLDEVSDQEWRAIVDANLTSAFLCTRAVIPGMKAARAGSIVNISSGAGRSVSLTGIQAYASAKAGQIGFTRQMAHELGPFGITVNCIAPGFVRSNPTTEKQWESYGEEGQRRLVEGIALRRLGRAEDIANGVRFFVSSRASWITGQVLSIDGGRSLF
jgi:3-oxoacyl-[acyl-carrier protein] reductase